MFKVSDTGLGISKDDQLQLFTLFGKLKSSSSVNTNGIGLGLNICKQIIEAFGGRIWVDSEVGFGTSFTFTFGCRVEQEGIIDKSDIQIWI